MNINKFVQIGGKISEQKHFSAIRDSFGTIIPFVMIAGVSMFFDLIFFSQNSYFSEWFNFNNSELWNNISFYISPFFEGISGGILSIISLMLCFNVGYRLSSTYGDFAMTGGFLSLISFVSLSPALSSTVLIESGLLGNGLSLYGSTGLVLAMIISPFAPTVFHHLNRAMKYSLKPKGVMPPAVTGTFMNLFPLVLTTFIVVLVQPIWGSLSYISGYSAGGILCIGSKFVNTNYFLLSWLFANFVIPVINISQKWWFVFLFLVIATTLFYFGIHGINALSVIAGVYISASVFNTELLINYGRDVYSTQMLLAFNDQIQTYFGTIGGTGATLGLAYAIKIFAASPQKKQLNKEAFISGHFNINEPIIFGFPIMLNVVYAIPFILIMPLNGAFITIAIQHGWMNPTIFIVPWATPAPIGAFLTTLDYRSIFICLAMIIVNMFLYLPFVLWDAKSQAKRDIEEEFGNLDRLSVEKYKYRLLSHKKTGYCLDISKAEDSIQKIYKDLDNGLLTPKNENINELILISKKIKEESIIFKHNNSITNKIDEINEKIEWVISNLDERIASTNLSWKIKYLNKLKNKKIVRKNNAIKKLKTRIIEQV